MNGTSTPKELAGEISRFVNRLSDRDTFEELARELANDHPTLQQSTMRMFMQFVQAMAEKPYTDPRNRAAHNLAKKIMEISDVDRILPLV